MNRELNARDFKIKGDQADATAHTIPPRGRRAAARRPARARVPVPAAGERKRCGAHTPHASDETHWLPNKDMTKLWEVSDETSTDRFPHFQCLYIYDLRGARAPPAAGGGVKGDGDEGLQAEPD